MIERKEESRNKRSAEKAKKAFNERANGEKHKRQFDTELNKEKVFFI